jgi:hypothetical protein
VHFSSIGKDRPGIAGLAAPHGSRFLPYVPRATWQAEEGSSAAAITSELRSLAQSLLAASTVSYCPDESEFLSNSEYRDLN